MWKGYSGQKRKEWQVGVLKGSEAGEIEVNYATMLNREKEEAKKKGVGAGNARYGSQEV